MTHCISYLGLRAKYRLLSVTPLSDLWAEEKPSPWSDVLACPEGCSWVGGEHLVELGHTGAAGSLGGPAAFTESVSPGSWVRFPR